MKKLILFVAFIINLSAFSQDDKTVTLVVSGQGKTQDEAKQNALRSAIEQAFGTFISSKTEILNDNLVKDEIVSIANGNIQKFDIISEVQIPNGGYASTLKATVSVTKLTSFIESKGVVVEFKGNLLATNIKQQMLNEKNEIKSMSNIVNVCRDILDRSFDFEIVSGEPKQKNNDNNKWNVPLKVNAKFNKNIELFTQYLYKSLKDLSMSQEEIEQYKSLGKKTYKLAYGGKEIAGEHEFSYRRYEPYKKSKQYDIISLLKSQYGTEKNMKYSLLSKPFSDHHYESNDLSEIEQILKNQDDSKYRDDNYKFRYWNENETSPLFHFRSKSSIVSIINLIYYIKHSVLSFETSNGINIINSNNFKIIYDNLTPIFVSCNEGGCLPRSVFKDEYCQLKLSEYEEYKNYDEIFEFRGIDYRFKNFAEYIDITKKYAFLKRPEFIKDPIIDAVISYNDFLYYSKVLLCFTYDDILDLKEVEKIQEYRIKPIVK
jgi:hypothetical protein